MDRNVAQNSSRTGRQVKAVKMFVCGRCFVCARVCVYVRTINPNIIKATPHQTRPKCHGQETFSAVWMVCITPLSSGAVIFAKGLYPIYKPLKMSSEGGEGTGEHLTATTSICNQAQHAMLHLKDVLCCSHFSFFFCSLPSPIFNFPREKTVKKLKNKYVCTFPENSLFSLLRNHNFYLLTSVLHRVTGQTSQLQSHPRRQNEHVAGQCGNEPGGGVHAICDIT